MVLAKRQSVMAAFCHTKREVQNGNKRIECRVEDMAKNKSKDASL